MVVRLRIWVEMPSMFGAPRDALESGGLIMSFVLLVDSGGGASDIGRSRSSAFLIASSVADGGVFSPRIDFGGKRLLFLRDGVSLRNSLLLGVGVTSLEVDLSGELYLSGDLLATGVVGVRSGDCCGVGSSIARMSLTALFCND
jgi:hypothetical protein